MDRFEAAGSPVVMDGDRRLLLLTQHGPFRYPRYADCYLDVAIRYAAEPWLIQLQQRS